MHSSVSASIELLVGGGAVIVTPYDEDFLNEFKVQLPTALRIWNPKERHWVVASSSLPTVRQLMQDYFPGYQEFDANALTEQTAFTSFYPSWHTPGRTAREGTKLSSAASWWEILYVSADAPIAVIEAAYRALAKMYHPDTGGDVEQMQRINQAVEYAREVKA